MESGVIRTGDQLEIEVIERIRIISSSGGIIVSVSEKKNLASGAGLGLLI